MNTEETIKHLSEVLAPGEVAELSLPSLTDAKTWYMRYRRAIDRLLAPETLAVSRAGLCIYIKRMPPSPVPVIKKLEDL